MRLQLIVAALLLAAPAEADSDVEASFHVYTDNDHVTVFSPAVTAATEVRDGWSVDASALVDHVTAASVDVLTQASPATVEDVRVELGMGARWTPAADRGLDLRAIASTEDDYEALHLSLGGHLEVGHRSTSLDAKYTFGAERAWSVSDPSASGSLVFHRGTVTLTQILDRRTYLDVVLDGRLADGYQASPYRQVPVMDAASTEITRVPEATPGVRRSVAQLVRVRHAFGHTAPVSVRADVRLYADDWYVKSMTTAAQVVAPLGDGWLLGAEGRFYAQSAASFYQAHYVAGDDGPPEHRTRDRTLGRMRSTYGAVLAELAVGSIRVAASLGVVHFRFLDYPPQDRRTAWVSSLTVRIAF